MSIALAIDIGASSGRHILGEYVNGEIQMTEVYRFSNGFVDQDGVHCWDIDHLNSSILEGLKKCKELNKIPDTVAIDTWGVDYVLLDENGKEILPAVSYRDARTEGIPELVDGIISREDLYAKTGIQRANYNTIYQLYCDYQTGKAQKASHMLLMPAYLTYKLTGVMKNEYTIASTTSLINAETKDWDFDVIETLGMDASIFCDILMPGSYVGGFTDEVKEVVGFDAKVLFAPSHDTASAVAACTLVGHDMYISSGTWSLIGAQNNYPVLNKEALKANFTNEGGTNGTYRFLKNIMGMWLFQSINRDLDNQYSHVELMKLGMTSSFSETFDPNDSRLLAPENMIEAIKECLGRSDLELPDVLGAVYHSLASSYAKVVAEIEEITGENVDCIHIVGGGCQNVHLNQLTEQYTGKPITVGPVEATAMGNLKTQLEFNQ